VKRQNELNAAEGVAQIMSLLAGVRFRVTESPDDANPQVKEVDFIITPESPSVPMIAMEHTTVEAFKGQMAYTINSFEIVSKIAKECNGRLPIDRYYILVLPEALVDSLNKKAERRFVNTVVNWLIPTAPNLLIDEYENWNYEGNQILLMCGGSHPKINGTLGRIPRRPDQQKNLAVESLWRGIHHGLMKFAKYKAQGYETVMCLQDISGEVKSTMLSEIERDADKGPLIEHLIDYIIVFASSKDQMVVGNVWKEKSRRYDIPPYNRRFENQNGRWEALNDA